MPIFFIFIPLMFFTSTCGSKSLTGAMFGQTQDTKRNDLILLEAQEELDKGEYDRSLAKLKEITNDPSPDSIELEAYSYLGKAGFDIFLLSEAFLNLKATTSGLQASDALNLFAKAFGIDAHALGQIGTLSPTAEELDSGDPKIAKAAKFFQDVPIYIPNDNMGVIENKSTPRGLQPSLIYLNKVVKLLCPYVNAAAIEKAKGTDPRYADCQQSSAISNLPSASLHFALAMAHLVEAVILNAVLNYTSPEAPDQKTSDLIQRAAKLKSASPTANQGAMSAEQYQKIKDFTDILLEFSRITKQIFGSNDPTKQSIIDAIVIDLETTLLALKQIDGIPDSFISPIQKAIDNLASTASKISSVSGGSDSSAAGTSKITAFKAQIKEQIDAQLKAAIGKNIDDLTKIDPAQIKTTSPDIQKTIKTSCDSYDNLASISGESGAAAKDFGTACTGN